MKKILIMFMMILGAISVNSTVIVSEKENNKEFISKYETWNLDLSEEELIQYYIDNDIRPTSALAGSGEIF